MKIGVNSGDDGTMHKIIFVGLLAIAGCGSDDSKPPDPPGECRTTIDTASRKNADCAIATGQITADQRDEYIADFKAGASTALDCSKITRILGNPDACTTDMNAMPCSLYDAMNGLPLPASCKGLYGM